ncbi:hypothetical protein D3C75_683700 [compost metagenome]
MIEMNISRITGHESSLSRHFHIGQLHITQRHIGQCIDGHCFRSSVHCNVTNVDIFNLWNPVIHSQLRIIHCFAVPSIEIING